MPEVRPRTRKPFAALLAAQRTRHRREFLERLAPGEAERILRQAALTPRPSDVDRFWHAMKTTILESFDA